MEDRYSNAFDKVCASDEFKNRMKTIMREMNTVEETVTRTSGNVPYRLKKKPLIILIAAALLMIAGTAFAIGLSAMIGARNRASEAIVSYQAVLEGKGQSMAITSDDPAPSPYITYTQFNADDNGQWLPNEIKDINVSAQVGELTVRLENLEYNDEFHSVAFYLWVEGEKPIPYHYSDLLFAVDGGEPTKTTFELQYEQDGGGPRPTPLPYADWDFDTRDETWLSFPMERNPLRVGTTFTLTGKLNGEPFTLTYEFTEEKYEAMRQTQLQEVGAIGQVIDAIPDETIPVNIAARWSLIEDMVITDHFLYYTETRDPSVHITGGPRPSAPYDTYDDGMWTVVDGMITAHEFLSASDDGNGISHAIYRSYFPYDDGNLPRESLVSLVGVVFRIEWATGKVTGPKDQAEYEAWRKESMELSAPDYGTDYIAKFEAKADTFSVTQAVYLNNFQGYFALVLETNEAVDKPLHGMDRQPVVTVNGVKLNNHTVYIQTPNDFLGGSDRDGKRVGFWLDAPAFRLLPEEFQVTVSWNGSETSFTLHKSDFQPGDAQSGEYHKLFGF